MCDFLDKFCRKDNSDISDDFVRGSTIVDTVAESQAITKKLLLHHQTIAVDFRGLNFNCEPPEGKVCIVAVAPCAEQCILYDVHSCPEIFTEGQLKELLQSPTITKVIHQGKRVVSYLKRLDVKLTPIFDTMLAHLIIQHHRTGKRLEEMNNVSISLISDLYGRIYIPSSQGKHRLRGDDGDYWHIRPIFHHLKAVVIRDVMCLPEAYESLKMKIPKEMDALFNDFCNSEEMVYDYRDEVIRQQAELIEQLKLKLRLQAQCSVVTEKKGKSSNKPRKGPRKGPGKGGTNLKSSTNADTIP